MENSVSLIVSILASACVSGLLTTIVTLWWQRKTKRKDSKLRIFETLMAYRYNIVAEDNVKALNSIDVIFHENKKVREAYSNFVKNANDFPNIDHNNEHIDNYLKLLEKMADVVGFKNIRWDSIKQGTYSPIVLLEKIAAENVHNRETLKDIWNKSQTK